MTMLSRCGSFGAQTLLVLTAVLLLGGAAPCVEVLALGLERDEFGGTHSVVTHLYVASDRSIHVLESFQVCPYFSSGPCHWFASAQATDLNGDGIDDLVTPQQVLLCDGDAHFTPAGLLDSGGSPPDVFLLADLDLDGDLDIIEAGEDFGSHSILNDGDGLFHYVEPLGAAHGRGGSRILAAGDVDGDGLPDVLAAGGVYMGRGDGQFRDPIVLAYRLDDPDGGRTFTQGRGWIEDLDGTPPAEVLVQGEIDGPPPSPAEPPVSVPGLYLFPRNAAGGFDNPRLLRRTERGYMGLELIDADGDGLLDSVESLTPGEDPKTGKTAVAWGLPGGSFADGRIFDAGGPVLADDLDGDGWRDMAIGSSIFWGTGPREHEAAATVLPGDLVLVGTGRFGAQFLRGDSETNGSLNISDAIATLRHLFQEADLSCPDVADANDDGRVDISDAIAILGYLFLGRVPGVGSFGREGLDLTPDDLGCAVLHGSIPEAPALIGPQPWPGG